MKKIFAFLLAVAMIFACAMPCFAATDDDIKDALAERYSNSEYPLTRENFDITSSHTLSNGTIAFEFKSVGWAMHTLAMIRFDEVGDYRCNWCHPYFYCDGEIYQGGKDAYDAGALNDATLAELSELYPNSIYKDVPEQTDEPETTVATPDTADPVDKGGSGPAVKTGSHGTVTIMLAALALVLLLAALYRRRTLNAR